MADYVRDPCPYRIVEDCGGAFAMGSIGGGAFQAIKGFRNAPAGFGRRLHGGIEAIKRRAASTGGSFCLWGVTFSIIDCTLVHLRGKEDPWNSIISGTAAGGMLAARGGLSTMIRGAIVGGILLAMIEGVTIATVRLSANAFRQLSIIERNENFRKIAEAYDKTTPDDNDVAY